MHVRCGIVAGFKGVLGKEIEIIDPNGGGSMFIFCDRRLEADWRSCMTPTLRKVGVKAK
jgi:hypothetical protein